MDPAVSAAIITVIGSIIVALISKPIETKTQEKKTLQRRSTRSASSSQFFSEHQSSRSTVERGAGVFFLIAWVCACTAGWTMGWLIGGMSANLIVLNTISGVIIGVVQWYVLQNKLINSGWWVLAPTIGGFGAGLTLSILGSTGFLLTDVLLLNVVGGLLTATIQWLVLRRQVPDAGYWIVIATVAWIMGGTIGSLILYNTGNFAISGLVCGIIVGLVTGSQLSLWLNRVQ